jgi:hypothetical protein
MDEHKHKILVTFVFFMAIFQVEKIEPLSSFRNKHISSTEGEENEER